MSINNRVLTPSVAVPLGITKYVSERHQAIAAAAAATTADNIIQKRSRVLLGGGVAALLRFSRV